jgi:hypothetical protein
MPGGDKTGPLGMGPRTGRQAGCCAGMDAQRSRRADRRSVAGRGAWCQGSGRGWRRWFHATGLPGWLRADSQATSIPATEQESETQALTRRANELQQELSAIQEKLQSMSRA